MFPAMRPRCPMSTPSVTPLCARYTGSVIPKVKPNASTELPSTLQ